MSIIPEQGIYCASSGSQRSTTVDTTQSSNGITKLRHTATHTMFSSVITAALLYDTLTQTHWRHGPVQGQGGHEGRKGGVREMRVV